MDQELNHNEERFLALLESKDFSELTAEEQLLIREFCTAEEYQLQRRMLAEAPQLFDTDAEPTPLVVEKTMVLPFWKRPVPLYQALTAVAATVALFFAIWPAQETSTDKQTQNGTQTASIDTIYRTKTIRDTVIRYEKLPPAKKHTHTQTTISVAEQPRMIEASGTVYIPTPSLSEITATGRSMKDDPAALLYLSTLYQYADR